MLVDGGVSLEPAALEAFRQRLPLAEGRVYATAPVQFGMRGLLQRAFGMVTRDQALMISRGHAMTLKGDPWKSRYGRALRTLPFRTDRPAP